MFNPKARIEFMAYYPALNVHITTINFHTKEEKIPDAPAPVLNCTEGSRLAAGI